MNHPVLPAQRLAPVSSANGGPSIALCICCSLPGAFLPEERWGSADKKVPAFHGILSFAAQLSGQCYFPLPFCKMTGELIALTLARKQILPLLQYNKGQ